MAMFQQVPSPELKCQLDLVSFVWFKWFRCLTCDFRAVFEEKSGSMYFTQPALNKGSCQSRIIDLGTLCAVQRYPFLSAYACDIAG
jgi:hypothetical protein